MDKQVVTKNSSNIYIRGCNQKFPDWPPGAGVVNGIALCHYFVTQSSEFFRHNSLCCFSTSVNFCCLFRYRLSPETSGYTLVHKLPLSLDGLFTQMTLNGTFHPDSYIWAFSILFPFRKKFLLLYFRDIIDFLLLKSPKLLNSIVRDGGTSVSYGSYQATNKFRPEGSLF